MLQKAELSDEADSENNLGGFYDYMTAWRLELG